MEARAIVRNVRMTPRKIKLICDLIRGKDAGEAMAIIMNTPKAACEPMEKLLKSAVANAENNHGMNTDKLYVKEVHVGPGPIMKRVMPRAQGRAFRILKRTSHVTLVLGEKEYGRVINGPESKSERSPCRRYQELGFPLVR